MMTVKEFMTKKVLTITEERTILDVAKKMASNDVGSLVIINKDKKPIGIITERDLLKKVVAFGRDTTKVKVKDVMSTGIKSVEEDTSLMKLSVLMVKHHHRRMPITRKGKLVGIVTSRDLIKIMSGL